MQRWQSAWVISIDRFSQMHTSIRCKSDVMIGRLQLLALDHWLRTRYSRPRLCSRVSTLFGFSYT